MLDAIGNTPIVEPRRIRQSDPDGVVVTLAVDSGVKYLSTELCSPAHISA